MNGQVHWHEGLFLQPHHLQGMQRSLMESRWEDRRLGWSYPYGLIDARLSGDALENLLVRFDRLRAVMPSGLEVDVPGNAELPALDIKRAFAGSSGSLTVRLGVPVWYATRGNTVDTGAGQDWRTKRLYRIAEEKHPDENTGENPQPMAVRRVNARLLLDDDDDTDLETLPVLRLMAGAGEEGALPRRDPRHIPPCLVLGAWPELKEQVRDLASQVEARRTELVLKMTRAGFQIDAARGEQVEQVLRLRTLNRFAASLPALAAAPALTPFDAYLELRWLLGELAAMNPARDAFSVPSYDHDNLALSFAELIAKIRMILSGDVLQRYKMVPFRREEGYWLAELTPEDVSVPIEYFLGIRTNKDPAAVSKLVEDADQFKVMSLSKIQRVVFGIGLREDRNPAFLPAQAGLLYYRMQRTDRSARMWQEIQAEKKVAIRWPDMDTGVFGGAPANAKDSLLSLYMTLPEKVEARP